jgi:hypothetical protein
MRKGTPAYGKILFERAVLRAHRRGIIKRYLDFRGPVHHKSRVSDRPIGARKVVAFFKMPELITAMLEPGCSNKALSVLPGSKVMRGTRILAPRACIVGT